MLLLVGSLGCVVAPFPPEYPYSFLNPLIEPWWEELDTATQESIYSVWEAEEPYLLAFAEAVDLRRRLRREGELSLEEEAVRRGDREFAQAVEDARQKRDTAGGEGVTKRALFSTTGGEDEPRRALFSTREGEGDPRRALFASPAYRSWLEGRREKDVVARYIAKKKETLAKYSHQHQNL